MNNCRPSKAPGAIVDSVTHYSIELSWEPHLEQLAGTLSPEDSRVRVEVQISKFKDDWEVAYKGYDIHCVCSGLAFDHDYGVRLRFGNGHGWGEFSDEVTVRTAGEPPSGEDLHRQIRRRNLDAFVQVLEAGQANPNAPDSKGVTPLTAAAMEGLIDFCRELLDHKADVNWSGDNGKTCLMMLAYKGKLGTLQWLLNEGHASLHLRDRNGLSALHYAVDGEQLENVRCLLEHGADLHAKDDAGCTPMLRCANHRNNGNPAVAVELINRGASIDETDSSGQTALFYCVINQHLKMAAVLLHHGANPNATNSKGLSVLKATEGQAPDKKAMRALILEYVEKRKMQETAAATLQGKGTAVNG